MCVIMCACAHADTNATTTHNHNHNHNHKRNHNHKVRRRRTPEITCGIGIFVLVRGPDVHRSGRQLLSEESSRHPRGVRQCSGGVWRSSTITRAIHGDRTRAVSSTPSFVPAAGRGSEYDDLAGSVHLTGLAFALQLGSRHSYY